MSWARLGAPDRAWGFVQKSVPLACPQDQVQVVCLRELVVWLPQTNLLAHLLAHLLAQKTVEATSRGLAGFVPLREQRQTTMLRRSQQMCSLQGA